MPWRATGLCIVHVGDNGPFTLAIISHEGMPGMNPAQ